MKFFKITLMVLAITFAISCKSKGTSNEGNTLATNKEIKDTPKLSLQDLSEYETAYFASGCFWCVEAVFESVKGVKEVVSGYAGGTEENPTYQQVGGGLTSHAEAVVIYYDPEVINYAALVRIFFGSHDPTTLNRQGPDRGPQYRSVAFHKNEDEHKIIVDYIETLNNSGLFDTAIITEVTPFTKFYVAEDYHQDYEKKHPNNSYIRNVSLPRLNRFKKNYPEYLKEGAH